MTAIEMKMQRWVEALRQAIAYQLGADRVWVAMPLAGASRAYRQRWRFEAQAVGLLAVDDRGHVRGPILAAPSPRLLPFVREKLLETFRIHESPLAAPGGFPTLEDDRMSRVASEGMFASLLASGSRPAFPSRPVLSAVSPGEQGDSTEN